MIDVFILTFIGSLGEPIEIAAYDTISDCQEIAYFMGADSKGRFTCEAAPVPAVTGDPLMFWPCPTEDSVNCYWNAKTHGNGRGRSFLDIDGNVIFLD